MSLSVKIKKSFGDFTLDVALEADNGVLGILGASGCGKSMTLKCIAGIERPDEGQIILDGVTLFDSQRGINLRPQERNVGYLFQNYALFPNMTVRQNILCGMNHEKDKSVRERALSDVVILMRLDGLENLRPHQLSGGQAQRTALARILVNRPKLLMLDEPFSALDSYLRGKLQIEMKALLENHLDGAVLMVTHSRDEAYHLCRRIAVMDNGEILTCQETKQLFADPGSVRASEITGCKNNIAARKVGEYEVEVPKWGVRFKTALPVRDDLKAIGIRAHYFNPRTDYNSFPVEFVGDMEEPFEWILEFRYRTQDPKSESIWWRLTKDRLPNPRPERLGVAPANVLLFYY